MKRVFLVGLLLLGFVFNAYAANEWQQGTGEDTPLGSESPSDIDSVLFQRVVDPLDRNLAYVRGGTRIKYGDAGTVTIQAGSVTCSNSAGTIRKMRTNTSDLSVTFSDLDTGNEAASTTYYVYAVADADATTFTAVFSTSSTTPTGVTYFKRLGYFTNNGDSDVIDVRDDRFTYDFYGDIEAASDVEIETGTVAQGGTIPLISGYTAAQVFCFIAPYECGNGDHDSGRHEDALDGFSYSVSSRVATAKVKYHETGWVNKSANYIIVGIKSADLDTE